MNAYEMTAAGVLIAVSNRFPFPMVCVESGGISAANCIRAALRAGRVMIPTSAKCVGSSRSVLAITLDREEVPVGILEAGDLAAAGAG